MTESNPGFFHRKPLFSAVIVGIVCLFIGGWVGIGIILGPVVAGFLYFRNMPFHENKGIWRSGAKAGALVSLVPAAPVLIFLALYISYSGGSAAVTLLFLVPLLAVWMILNAGFGAFGAWLKSWHSQRAVE